MKRKMVMGNWKMNGSLKTIDALLSGLCTNFPTERTVDCVVFPPFPYLSYVGDKLQGSPIALGAQNVYPAAHGAFTGEVSGPMLNDCNCQYVLVGHSERRQLLQENEKFVAEKFHHVKEHGMIPVLCIGETQKEREKGMAEAVLSQQLQAVMNDNKAFALNSVIAYEPVWAIGTGETALPEQAQEVHAFIRALVAEHDPENAGQMPILYGGSLNEQNARSLFAMPDVDGGLVGGASLKAEQFVEILKCIN